MKHIFIAVLIGLIGATAFSKNLNQSKIKVNEAKIKALVDDYYNQQLLMTLNVGHSNHPGCEPTEPTCLDVACKHLSKFECDDMDEIRQINRACRGNYNGNCLDKLCGYVGKFSCDDIKEIKQLAPACVGNYNTKCIENTCSRLSKFECDDIDEVVEVAQYCSGNK